VRGLAIAANSARSSAFAIGAGGLRRRQRLGSGANRVKILGLRKELCCFARVGTYFLPGCPGHFSGLAF